MLEHNTIRSDTTTDRSSFTHFLFYLYRSMTIYSLIIA